MTFNHLPCGVLSLGVLQSTYLDEREFGVKMKVRALFCMMYNGNIQDMGITVTTKFCVMLFVIFYNTLLIVDDKP